MPFRSLETSAALAAERAPDCLAVADYAIAGFAVRTRIVGERFAGEVERPLAHLRADHDDEDKPLICMAAVFPDRMGRSTEIKAVSLPRVGTTNGNSLRPASKAEAFRALAPTSMAFLPGGGPRSIGGLAELVGQVPSYHRDLGGDPAEVPGLVQTGLWGPG